MQKIGSHVSFANTGLLNAVEEAHTYGSTTFMVYTGAPQNTRRKPIESMHIEEGKKLMHSYNIEDFVVHAPYIINLASAKPSTSELAVEFLINEIQRTSALGARQIILHPGAYVDQTCDEGLQRIITGLNHVLDATQDANVQIALETMAGKGTEIGRSFEELARIIDGVKHADRLSVCFDTCHVHDAGYDIVNDLDQVLDDFDRIVGLERIRVLHLNDSKNEMGAKKDRHTPLGTGFIGFEAISNVVHHEKLKNRPAILETPWIGKDPKSQRPMYKIEIALLLKRTREQFGDAFVADVKKLSDFFPTQNISNGREFVLERWKTLKTDKEAKKIDKREPLEQLYDKVCEGEVFPTLSEEERLSRIVAWLSRQFT